jgi:Flp pilus assembly protein TadG
MTRRAGRLIARLRGDARGVTIVEFALIAPALLTILLGVFDIGFNMYVTSVLDGATQKAGRDSTIEGAETQGLAIDDSVRDAVHRVIPSATLSFDRRSYRDYSDVHRP